MRVEKVCTGNGFRAGQALAMKGNSTNIPVSPFIPVTVKTKDVKANNWRATFAVLSALLLANLGLYSLQIFGHNMKTKKD